MAAMPDPSTYALSSAATARNREPLLQVLKARLPAAGLVLEIAAGAGEHARYFARAFPDLQWRPTDADPDALASIAAWREQAGTPNLLQALRLDAADPDSWPVGHADVVICINMIHISPWTASEGLMAGAGKVLPPGGLLVTYGPYLERDLPTAPSNLAFDRDLRARNPAWGLRDRDELAALAQAHGLTLIERVAMPANNLTLVFRKG
jgi:SAM-dependent methyltransferase